MQSIMGNGIGRRLLVMSRPRLILLAATCLMAQWTLNMKLKDLEPPFVEPPQERDTRWNADLFRALTFGQLPMAVDWLWMKTLQDSTLTHVTKGRHAGVYFDLDLATDIDPAYYEAYTAGSNVLAIIRDDVAGARDLLLKAERFRKEELPRYPEDFKRNFW